MDMYKLKFTRLQNEIIRLLCIKTGKTLNQRTIAGMLKVSPTAVANAVKKLERDNLIMAEKSQSMNLVSIHLNRDNQRVIVMKRSENLKLIYESGLSDYLEENFPGCPIVLFGSYSTGEDTVKSDIDLAIIGSNEKELNLIEFEKALERVISIHYFRNLKKINGNLKANIINGIILHETIEI